MAPDKVVLKRLNILRPNDILRHWPKSGIYAVNNFIDSKLLQEFVVVFNFPERGIVYIYRRIRGKEQALKLGYPELLCPDFNSLHKILIKLLSNIPV